MNSLGAENVSVVNTFFRICVIFGDVQAMMILLLVVMGSVQTHAAPKPAMPFTNTLGMRFIPVSGTRVQFSVWETRVKDYAEYAVVNSGVDDGWKNFVYGGFIQPETHPVVNVNWNDAQAFCAWLTEKELREGKIKAGQRYRLPTDAEWSIAVGLAGEPGNTPRDRAEASVPAVGELDPELIADGKVLFQSKSCFTCHQTAIGVPAPAGLPLKAPKFMGDFWGKEREVELNTDSGSAVFVSSGKTRQVKLDDEYFMESLLKPNAMVVKGAVPAMPLLPTTLEERNALMAYVKSQSGTGARIKLVVMNGIVLQKIDAVKGLYPWGKKWPPPEGAGNYGFQGQGLKAADTFKYTSPAGSFTANAYGLHDMGGNAYEWCEDWHDSAKKQHRVLRGASWNLSSTLDLLASYRHHDSPGNRIINNGFRCVLTDGTEAAAEPVKPEPTPTKHSLPKAFVNTLGMKFVPVPGTEVQFSLWETRVKDYATFAAANADVAGEWKDFGYGFKQADTHPVVAVNWNEAQVFCEWLTSKELAEGKIKVGQKYRLPTDTEWSVAAGLGRETGSTPQEKSLGIKGVYPWGKGNPPPKGAGNYYKNHNADSFDYTSPVGSFVANKFGLHDMGGNVWEWCRDRLAPTSGYRVLRGASWGDIDADNHLSSFRFKDNPIFRSSLYGFRCVLTGGSGR